MIIWLWYFLWIIEFSVIFLLISMVTTCLENLEMSDNLTAVREMSGILLKVREMSEKILSWKSCLKLYCKLHIYKILELELLQEQSILTIKQ